MLMQEMKSQQFTLLSLRFPASLLKPRQGGIALFHAGRAAAFALPLVHLPST